jgi:hypothetical protein
MTPNIPPPAEAPDEVRDDTWNPEVFPAHIGGIIEERETLIRKRDGKPFEKLVIGVDGDSIPVLCGRKHIAQLVEENDPQPGDAISISCFGRKDGSGEYLYGLRVDKSGRLRRPDDDDDAVSPARELAEAMDAEGGDDEFPI